MNMDDILKKLEQKYNCSAVNFYKYNESFVIKGIDKSNEYVSFRYFITKNEMILSAINKSI